MWRCCDKRRYEYFSRSFKNLRSNWAVDSYTFCFWLTEQSLLVFRLDDEDIKSELVKHKDIVGLNFNQAFPGITNIEQSYWTDEDGEIDINWEQDTLNKIQAGLNKGLLELGETKVAGIPLKQEILLFGGPPLLLMFQLYFLLHFRNFFQCINTRELSVPWIGAYPDCLSRFVFFCTVTLLPPVTLILIATEKLSAQPQFILAIIISSIIVSFLQAHAIVDFWKQSSKQ